MTQIFRALFGAAALAALPVLATAQEAPAERNIEARETAWQVNCTPAQQGGELRCSMVKSLILAEGNKVLAQVAVVGGEPPNLRLLAPHGMSIPAGLTLNVDGREGAQAPFNTSLPGGVIAVVELTPELEGALRFGNQLTVVGTQNSGSGFNFQVNLSGFSASIEKVK